MTTANIITLVRMAMIPFFIFFGLKATPSADIIALVLFVVASATDALDGYVARKYNQITDFGKFVDPLADKLLVVAALLIFIERGQMASWLVFIIVAREFIITSLRIVAMSKGRVMAAAWSGKVKTAIQIAGCVAIFAANIVAAYIPEIPTAQIILCSGWLMALITLYSGFDYLKRNWDIVAQGATSKK